MALSNRRLGAYRLLRLGYYAPIGCNVVSILAVREWYFRIPSIILNYS